MISNAFSLSPSPKITIEAMKSDIDEVALQGIEFWSNVCDEEMDLAIEASEVSDQGVTVLTFCSSLRSMMRHHAPL